VRFGGLRMRRFSGGPLLSLLSNCHLSMAISAFAAAAFISCTSIGAANEIPDAASRSPAKPHIGQMIADGYLSIYKNTNDNRGSYYISISKGFRIQDLGVAEKGWHQIRFWDARDAEDNGYAREEDLGKITLGPVKDRPAFRPYDTFVIGQADDGQNVKLMQSPNDYSAPVRDENNRVVELPARTRVTVQGYSGGGWLKIAFARGDKTTEGYIGMNHLDAKQSLSVSPLPQAGATIEPKRISLPTRASSSANSKETCIDGTKSQDAFSACNEAIFAGQFKGRDLALLFYARALTSPTAVEPEIADYSEAIRLGINFAGAFKNRSYLYYLKQDFDRAIADSSEAIKVDPKDASLFYNRGYYSYWKHDIDAAIADYSEAIRLDAQFTAAYNEREHCYWLKHEHELARSDQAAGKRLPEQNHEPRRTTEMPPWARSASTSARGTSPPLASNDIDQPDRLVVDGPRASSSADFVTEFRRSLSLQVKDLGPYAEDMKFLSGSAAKCPAITPSIGDDDFARDSYWQTSARECERDLVEGSTGTWLPKPSPNNAEPRKLFVSAHAKGKPLPGSKKTTYRVSVYIERAAQSCAAVQTANAPPSSCAIQLVQTIIVSEAELAAAKQHDEQAKQQATVAAAEDGRKREAERAARGREAAARAVLDAAEKTPAAEKVGRPIEHIQPADPPPRY
jgi:tetratricopeptide (TPR) repeat protein